MAVIVWYLDLQLPMQSVPITTDVVNRNLGQGEVYSMHLGYLPSNLLTMSLLDESYSRSARCNTINSPRYFQTSKSFIMTTRFSISRCLDLFLFVSYEFCILLFIVQTQYLNFKLSTPFITRILTFNFENI